MPCSNVRLFLFIFTVFRSLLLFTTFSPFTYIQFPFSRSWPIIHYCKYLFFHSSPSYCIYISFPFTFSVQISLLYIFSLFQFHALTFSVLYHCVFHLFNSLPSTLLFPSFFLSQSTFSCFTYFPLFPFQPNAHAFCCICFLSFLSRPSFTSHYCIYFPFHTQFFSLIFPAIQGWHFLFSFFFIVFSLLSERIFYSFHPSTRINQFCPLKYSSPSTADFIVYVLRI